MKKYRRSNNVHVMFFYSLTCEWNDCQNGGVVELENYDECVAGIDNCGDDASCTNTNCSHACECDDSYSGTDSVIIVFVVVMVSDVTDWMNSKIARTMLHVPKTLVVLLALITTATSVMLSIVVPTTHISVVHPSTSGITI